MRSRRRVVTTLTLIADPFPDPEAAVHSAAIRDLANAVARVAPRGCGARVLVSRTGTACETEPTVEVERLPFSASALPQLWRSGLAARPLDGEYVHALTPLAPLRARHEDDGTQTTVMVPHALAWQAPELMGPHAKLYRSYVKRAVKLADAVLTPTHATAQVLHEQYGSQLPVRVVPLAAPTELLGADESAAYREAHQLPTDYLVTVSPLGEHGRLEVLFEALASAPDAPDAPSLVAICPAEALEAVNAAVPASLQARVIVIAPNSLAEVGALISGAQLLLSPQLALGTGYEIIAAIATSVPVVATSPAALELALDGGVAATAPGEFVAAIEQLTTDHAEYGRRRVLATDRARTYDWNSIAWQLWELHASL